MKIKTSELDGVALDWAAALACLGEPAKNADGWLFDEYGIDGDDVKTTYLVPLDGRGQRYRPTWAPSRKWSQGGTLIERHRVSLGGPGCMGGPVKRLWSASIDTGSIAGSRGYGGPAALIAAMRAIVASELGDEVDVPDELAEAS